MSLFSKNILCFLLFPLLFSCKTDKNENEASIEDSQTKVAEKKISALEKRLIAQGLVNIQEVDSTIKVVLKYSTTDNFFGKDVYGDLENAYFQKDVAAKLKIAQAFLKKEYPAYSLLVYDGVRPHSVQEILWDALDTIPTKKREAYVANPKVGSIHNYGCAVDLTIFDNKTNTPLDMGTKYDYFGYLAYPRMETKMLNEGKLSKQQIGNRMVLRNAMKYAGFMPITSEWWHFNFITRKNAEKKYLIVK